MTDACVVKGILQTYLKEDMSSHRGQRRTTP